MNAKLHAICDSHGRPIELFLTGGPVSDYIGARALVSGLPKVKWLLGDRGYDANWFREALQDKKIPPASRVGRNGRRPSGTTSADTSVATGSRSCSVGSRIGGVSRPVMTAAPRCFSLPSRSRLSSFIGYES